MVNLLMTSCYYFAYNAHYRNIIVFCFRFFGHEPPLMKMFLKQLGYEVMIVLIVKALQSSKMENVCSRNKLLL